MYNVIENVLYKVGTITWYMADRLFMGIVYFFGWPVVFAHIVTMMNGEPISDIFGDEGYTRNNYIKIGGIIVNVFWICSIIVCVQLIIHS